MEIKHHNEKQYFSIHDGQTEAGEMTYRTDRDGDIVIDHTGIKKKYGGQGLGKKLVRAAVMYARENNLKIVPICPFVAAEFKKNKEYEDVLKN